MTRSATGRERWRVLGLAGAVFVLSLVPRLLTAGRFTTFDEPGWLRRSSHFWDSLGSADFAEASAHAAPGNGPNVTMPGVTTMWVGSFARGVWSVGRSWGLWAGEDATFLDSPSGLAVAQASMALATSALIVVVTLLVAKWVGPEAGVLAGTLLATEPYLVLLGTILHTDELMSLFGIGALVAAALALGLPGPTSWQGRRRVAALSGGLFAGAFLTKVAAVAFLVGLTVLVAWALGRVLQDHRRGEPTGTGPAPGDGDGVLRGSPPDARSLGRMAVVWTAMAVAVTFAAYPALWLHPWGELQHMVDAARMVGHGHNHYFLGERTETPGVTYLFVTIPLRSTPWFLVAGVAAGAVILWRRVTRGYGLVALAMALPTFVAVSLASKQSIRYGLPVTVVGALVIGIVGAGVLRWASEHPGWRRPVQIGAVAAIGLVFWHSVAVTPWGNAYFNPLLGGSSTAERATTIGSGEGLDVAGDLIRDREADRCDDLLIWSYQVRPAFPCGEVTSHRSHHPDADYVVLYVNQRQRQEPEFLAELVDGRPLLDTVEIRDILYAEIYGPTDPPETD